jgi:hypothetical protein
MKRAWWLMLTSVALAAYAVSAGSAGEGKVVDLDGLKSRAPANWKSEKPANKFRAYQFVVPRADGDKEDAELVIFYFDKGGGGGVDENIRRWKGFFQPPEGKTLDEVSKVEKFKVGAVPVTYLDVRGTFLSKTPPFDPNAKTVRKPDFRRFGVIFESKDGPYFITLTGPAKTLEKQKPAFDGWLKGFK